MRDQGAILARYLVLLTSKMTDIEEVPLTPSPPKPKRPRSEAQKAHWIKVQEARKAKFDATKAERAAAQIEVKKQKALRRIDAWKARLPEEEGESSEDETPVIDVDDLVTRIATQLRVAQPPPVAAPTPQRPSTITLSYV